MATELKNTTLVFHNKKRERPPNDERQPPCLLLREDPVALTAGLLVDGLEAKVQDSFICRSYQSVDLAQAFHFSFYFSCCCFCFFCLRGTMCAPSYKTYFFVLIGLYLCGVSLFLVYSSSHPDVVSVHSPGSAGAALDATKEQLAYSEQQASRDPLLLLKFRLARGEISSEEFQQMAGLLAVVDRAATALQSQKETRGGEGFNTDRQNVDAAAADGEKSSGTALGRSNSHVIPTTTPAIVAAAASEGNEVTVDILKSAPTNPMVVRGTAYDAHVTLYIEALGGALTPAGWSTRKIHGGDGKPFRFIPGKGLIEGWTLGVLKMHEGERAGLHVPSKLGYGASAQGSKGGAWYIPANSNLYFDIEVLESSSSDGQRGNEGGKIRRPSRHNAAGQNSQASGISAVSPAAKPKPSAHIPPMPIDDERAKAVRDGFRHAFGGYRAHAWGADEFKPQSGVGKATVWGGMGMMILDALDTCMVMGLDDEYAASVAWITENLDFGRVGKVCEFGHGFLPDDCDTLAVLNSLVELKSEPCFTGIIF